MNKQKISDHLSDLAQIANGVAMVGQTIAKDMKKNFQFLRNPIKEKDQYPHHDDMAAMQTLIAEQAEKIKSLEEQIKQKQTTSSLKSSRSKKSDKGLAD